MTAPAHSPLPFELVEATEHHGFYITTAFGTTICDFYEMSDPSALSTASGGPSKPIHYVDAEGNARLFIKAVNSHAELLAAAKHIVSSCCIDPDVWPQTINALQAAIATAEKDAL